MTLGVDESKFPIRYAVVACIVLFVILLLILFRQSNDAHTVHTPLSYTTGGVHTHVAQDANDDPLFQPFKLA